MGNDDVSVAIAGVQGTLSSANAGNYTKVNLSGLTLTGDDKAKYKLNETIENVDLTSEVVIGKLDATITVGVTSYVKKYGDDSFSLGVTDSNPDAEATYTSDNGSVATVSDDGTVTIQGGGSATITVSLAESTNYNAAESKVITVVVNKLVPTVVAVPTVAAQVYNPNVTLADIALTGGTVQGANGSNLAGTWSWETETIIPVVNNSGYIAVFTPTDSTNYESVTKTINVTVTKATPVAAVRPSATAITYGDTLGTSVLSGGSAQYSGSDTTEVTGSFAWKDASAKPVVADSGVTGYTVVFTPEDSANYNSAETQITVTVNRVATAPNMPSATMNVAYK